MEKWTEGKLTDKSKQENRPSRLWLLLHLWGGMCLYAYINVSGLAALILGTPTHPTSAAASNYAGKVTALAVASVLVGYILSKSLINTLNSSDISKNVKTTIKISLPIIYFIASILLSFATGTLLTKNQATTSSITPSSKEASIKPVLAFTSTQDANGLTQDSLDSTALKKFETWIVTTTIQKGKNRYKELGLNPNDFNPKIDASSLYVVVSGKKLGVVKLKIANLVRTVTILGFQGKQFIRVTCIRNSNHDIPVWSGKCGDKIKEEFGVQVKP